MKVEGGIEGRGVSSESLNCIHIIYCVLQLE